MERNEDKIRKAFSDKSWNEVKVENSWQIFKVIAEFVEGFEKMSRIGPCVSIFGSARTKPGNKYYELAEDIACKLTKEGYGIITGGGPGIMEAGNLGAVEGEGGGLYNLGTATVTGSTGTSILPIRPMAAPLPVSPM